MDREWLTQIAEKLVGEVLAIKPGESVSIVCDFQGVSSPVTDAVVRACLKAGTDPACLVMQPRSINGAELPPPMTGAFVDSKVLINLSGTSIAHVRAGTAALKAGARMGSLRDFGAGVLRSPGILTDYQAVKRNALALDAMLEKGKDIHITTPSGTDLTLQLCGRKGKAQTGFATEPGTFTGLPDGESTVAPLEGTTNGRLVNPYIMEKIGLIDEPFEMEVCDGFITSIEGGRQAQALEALLEGQDPDARRFASQIAFGINPDCRVMPVVYEVSKRLGTMHLAIGDNYSLGGTIQAGHHMDIVILDCTVTLDGETILENGKLYL